MNLLTQYIEDEDKELIEDILNTFSSPDTDRGRLIQTANNDQTLNLEKKYVPLIDHNRSPSLPCDVLICPVGLRPLPVILTALILKPRKLYLLHSPDSLPFAETIRDDAEIQKLGLDPYDDIYLREISLTNAPDNYEILRKIVNSYSNKHVVVDITGGVKVMGVSLAAAAFWQRLPVVYLFGEEVKGIIKPFTERLNLLQNPYDHFGDTEFKLLANFFDTYNYDAALRICLALRGTVRDVATLGTLDILAELIELYRDWDSFAHSQWQDTKERKLATRLRVLIGKMERLNLHLASFTKLQQNLSFLDEVEASWQGNRRNLADKFRLVDVFCAAKRRAMAGKYDDAVARLYRCLEMSSTVALVEDWNIESPKRPNLAQLINQVGTRQVLQEKFREIAPYDLPQGRLGLDAQMKLLEIGSKHQQICGIYKDMSSGNPSLMEWRNRSTLAHGTVPVSKEIYKKFFEKTEVIIASVIGRKKLHEMIEQATHPKLSLFKG